MADSSGAFCRGDYYAGKWSTSDTGVISCEEQLTGSTVDPSASIEPSSILDRDYNIIGLQIKYTGAPSNEYIQMNIYCSRDQTFQWDGSYLPHTDTAGKTYYQMTMNSEYGCAAIETDSYWSYLKNVKFIFGLVGIVGGLISCMAGRLLLSYVIFASVVAASISIANLVVFTIDNNLSTTFYWVTFGISAFCGILLALLSTKYRGGGATVLAGWTGFEIGATFSNLLYFQFKSVIFFWMIIGLSSLVMMLIAGTNINHHMIWVTSIFGSYLFIVSFSLFYGRWPIELNMPKL